jgi:hypothetical protein
MREMDRIGVAGRALFSWDSIVDSPELKAALAAEAKLNGRAHAGGPRARGR